MAHLGTLADFTDHASRSVALDGRMLLVVRRGPRLYVYENRCPHTHGTLDPLGGSVTTAGGLLLRCQRHAADFVADTGECVAGPCVGERLQVVPFRLVGEEIYLD